MANITNSIQDEVEREAIAKHKTISSPTGTQEESTVESTEETDYYHTAINEIKQKNQYSEIENSGCFGVEIDGFLFLPDELPNDNSYSKREYKRTSIMSGGEFVSRTTYTPKEFSFKTSLEINPDEPDMFDSVFNMMVNKEGGCEILTPYMGVFKGEVDIKKTYPTSNPCNMDLEIKIKEIPDVNATLYGDGVIEYPSVTSLSDKVVTIQKETEADSTQNQIQQELQIEYENPYNDGYVNGYDD